MDKFRWLFHPQDTTIVDVMFFYVHIISRFMPELTGIFCSTMP